MAWIDCPECRRQVSDRAYACPECGYPIQEWVAELKKDGYSVMLEVQVGEEERRVLRELFHLGVGEMEEKTKTIRGSKRSTPLVSGLSEEEAKALVEQAPDPSHLKVMPNYAVEAERRGRKFRIPAFFIHVIEILCAIAVLAMLCAPM